MGEALAWKPGGVRAALSSRETKRIENTSHCPSIDIQLNAGVVGATREGKTNPDLKKIFFL